MRKVGKLQVSEEVFRRKSCWYGLCAQRPTHYVFRPNGRALGVFCKVDAEDWQGPTEDGLGFYEVRARKRFDAKAVHVGRDGQPVG